MQTDNVYYNIILAMFIPFLLSNINFWVILIKDIIQKKCNQILHGNYNIRTIKYEPNNIKCEKDEKDNTNLLYKSIMFYVNNNRCVQYNNGDYKFINTNFTLKNAIYPYHTNSILKELQYSKIITQPEHNLWIQVTKHIDFKLSLSNNVNSENDDQKNIIILELRSSNIQKKAKDIDCFLKKCVRWYIKYIESNNVNNRYMYMLDTYDNNITYKKYTLSCNKTFETIFIPNKTKIIQIINDFQSATGKFSIEGFPKQLNILLSGPPGTGKTSLIKSISQYTNRHIIDIPLTKIKTTKILYEIMYSKRFFIQEDGFPDKYEFDQIIFVIEDIDCTSNIVYNREEMQQTHTHAHDEYSDKLTLSSILNVIDGVIECPNRILIITTNHPEKLDPALIRPGRININILLENIKITEILQMISHYVKPPNKKEQEKIYKIFKDNIISPATIEKLCIEYDTIDDVINEINKSII